MNIFTGTDSNKIIKHRLLLILINTNITSILVAITKIFTFKEHERANIRLLKINVCSMHVS